MQRKRNTMVQKPATRKSNRNKNLNNSNLRMHPPQINGYEITHSKTLRFTATAAATNTAITFTNLLNTIGIVSAATQGYLLFDQVKIRRVRVWGISALGTPSSVSVTFVGGSAGLQGDLVLHQDTSLGFEPAFVSAVPSSMCTCAFWQTVIGTTAFILTCPAGSTIDCDLSFRDTPGNTQAATGALVAGTVGAVYYRGLDGIAIATTNFPPPVGIYSL